MFRIREFKTLAQDSRKAIKPGFEPKFSGS